MAAASASAGRLRTFAAPSQEDTKKYGVHVRPCSLDELTSLNVTLQGFHATLTASPHEEVRKAAALELFYFQDKPPDAGQRNARRLCFALRKFAEHMIVCLKSSGHIDIQTDLQDLRRFLAWAGHALAAPDDTRARELDINVAELKVLLERIARNLNDAPVLPALDGTGGPCWTIAEDDIASGFDIEVGVLNDLCERIRSKRDDFKLRWLGVLPADQEAWCASEGIGFNVSLMLSACDHVFSFIGHPSQVPRLCFALRLFAESARRCVYGVQGTRDIYDAMTGLYAATVWAGHSRWWTSFSSEVRCERCATFQRSSRRCVDTDYVADIRDHVEDAWASVTEHLNKLPEQALAAATEPEAALAGGSQSRRDAAGDATSDSAAAESSA